MKTYLRDRNLSGQTLHIRSVESVSSVQENLNSLHSDALQLIQIATWITAPYKKPERDLPDNERFNNHVSMIRIRSEHAIGYLKGRFQSLKELRIRITDKKSHKFATYWVAACIAVHNFALRCEAEERVIAGDEDTLNSFDGDAFIYEGLEDAFGPSGTAAAASRESREQGASYEGVGGGAAAVRLARGKARREELKLALFRSQEQRRTRRIREQIEEEEWVSDLE